MLTIATWNVNSLRAREARVSEWLREHAVDVLCMQETKVIDKDFPAHLFEEQGYHVAFAGQKTYNGVAIAAREPLEQVEVGLAGAEEADDKRLMAATVSGVRVFCVYVPNGKSVDSPSFQQKLVWLDRLRETVRSTLKVERNVMVCGDFNIAPGPLDVFDPELYAGQLHYHPKEHAALEALCSVGLRDALRALHPEQRAYTWWDYRGGAFRRDRGLRIDHAFVSDELWKRCELARVDREERGKPKPSDHAPVVFGFRG